MTENRVSIFLLGGGKGTRIKQLGTNEVLCVPKPLIRVTHRGKTEPMAFHAIDALLTKGYERFVALVGSDPDTGGTQIIDAFKRRYSTLIDLGKMSLDFSVENTPLGTAGAVYQAACGIDGLLVITPLDTLFPYEGLPNLLSTHSSNGWKMAWVVTSNPGNGAQNAGRILVERHSRTIAHALDGSAIDPSVFVSPSIERLTSAGVIIAEAGYFVKCFQAFKESPYITYPTDLYRQFIPWLVTQGETIGTVDVKTPVIDLGTPERIIPYLPKEAFLN